MGLKCKIVSLNVHSVLETARFSNLYNVMMSSSVDVFLLQETYLQEEDAARLESAYPLIQMVAHNDPTLERPRGGVVIMINFKTTSWDALQGTGSQVVYKDPGGRIIAAQVKVKDKSLVVASVYVPAKPVERIGWLDTVNSLMENHSPTCPIDVLGGDWNQTTQRIDRRSRQATPLELRANLQKLIDNLGNNQIEYVDGWRSCNQSIIAYTYFEGKEGVSRLDKIYLREDWMLLASKWDIVDLGLQTDHKAVLMVLKEDDAPDREPGRWRLNPQTLKLPEAMPISTNALKECITERPEDVSDEFSEWLNLKSKIAIDFTQLLEELKDRNRAYRRELSKRRVNLWRKRVPGVVNRDLENSIAMVE